MSSSSTQGMSVGHLNTALFPCVLISVSGYLLGIQHWSTYIIVTVGGQVWISSYVCTVCIIMFTSLSFCTDQKSLPLLLTLPVSLCPFLHNNSPHLSYHCTECIHVFYLKSEEEMTLETSRDGFLPSGLIPRWGSLLPQTKEVITVLG